MSTKTDVRWLAEDAAELEAIARVVSGVVDPRRLALDVVEMLIVAFTAFCHEAGYVRVNGELLTLLSWARTEPAVCVDFRPDGQWCAVCGLDARVHPLDMRAATRKRADQIASLCYAGCAKESWPEPHQVAHDIATALRRACEPEPDLALILRDAKRLLAWARKDPKRIDELVARAMREAVAA